MAESARRDARAWLWPGLSGLVLLFLAWRVLSLGLADHYADTAPATALAWRSAHPQAQFALAEQLAGTPDTSAAAEHARLALRADPLDGRAYRVLGGLAADAGDRDRAAALFALAAARTPRDVLSQAWLLDDDMARGDAVAALGHLDLMLRTKPSLFDRLQPVLMALAAEPGVRGALLDRLGGQPPWRAVFVTQAARQVDDLAAIAPLFEGLRTGPGGLSPVEANAWLDRLAREGQWGQAYLVWASLLSPEQLGVLGNVYNGGFEQPLGKGGFDWRVGRVAGARISRLPGRGVQGKYGLRIAFDGQRTAFNHLRQLMALPPGSYRLTGRAWPDRLRTERGLVWSVTCATDGRALGQTEPLRGTGDWREFSADFDVPAAGCGGQWLSLRLPARIDAEQRIGGSLWLDDMRIRRREE